MFKTFNYPLVEPCASFLSRYPAVEWVVIIDENTDFFIDNFIALIHEEGWNPVQDIVFIGKEMRRYNILKKATLE